MISTAFVIHLADKSHQTTSKKCLPVIGIAILHILAGGADQFISNVLKGNGFAHQVIRDLGFMIPDILHFVVPIWLLKRSKKEDSLSQLFYKDKSLRKDVTVMFVIVIILFTICSIM